MAALAFRRGRTTLARWCPGGDSLLRWAAGFFALLVASTLLNHDTYAISRISLIWLPNGYQIGVIASSPRRRWPCLIVAGALIDLLWNVLGGSTWTESIAFSCFNLSEVLIGAFLIAPSMKPRADLTQGKQLRAFLLYGVLLGPIVASLLASAYFRVISGTPMLVSAHYWFAADALGTAMVVPVALAHLHRRSRGRRTALEVAAWFLLLIAVALTVFRWTTGPWLWPVLLLVLFLGLRLGLSGAASALLVVTFLGGYMTVKGYGPLGSSQQATLPNRILYFQLFMAFSMIGLYVIELALAEHRRVSIRLVTSEAKFRSIAETSRDAIVLADLDGRRQYVSPGVTDMLGWTPAEMLGETYLAMAHPEDVASIAQNMEDIRRGLPVKPHAYRSRRKDGEYLWLEATVNLLRHPETGEPDGFVYTLRDISYRKAAEEQMARALETMQRAALMDGLTGVANRRLLDETLRREWLSGRRNGESLAVLLIDVDYFKRYNDCYGHLAGDECLKIIAQEISGVLRRPEDMLARYGGEEFVVVLPRTTAAGSEALAEQIRGSIALRAIPHATSPWGMVTVSIGCAAELPKDDSNVTRLLADADFALYRAKAMGRNQFCQAKAVQV